MFRMRTRLRFALAIGVCAIGVSTPGAAQSTLPSAGTIHVSSRLVVLDVSVVDQSGHFVAGLDKSQFNVTEGGVPQIIRYFEGSTQHTLPPGKLIVRSSADLTKIGNAPVTILVLDELNTPFADRSYAQQMMVRYLLRQPAVMPSPTLLLAAGDARISVLHDYTQDRDGLLDSVRHHFPDYPWTMMRQGTGDQMSRTLGALDQIADSSRGTTGRKNVVWVGTGYPSVDETGMSAQDAQELNAAIEIVLRKMMEARVTLYTLDPGGPQVTPPAQVITGSGATSAGTGPALGPFDPNDVDFVTFATSTGGRVLFARNDVDTEISEEVAEGRDYYTLSYVPTSESTDAQAYRQIRVTMKDPHLTATTRHGYFTAPAAVDKVQTDPKKMQPQQLSFDMMSAAKTNLIYNGLHVEAVRSTSGYSVLVGAHEMHWTSGADGQRTAEFTVLAIAYSAKGKALGEHAEELTEQIAPNDSIERGRRITLSFPFAVPAQTDHVRLVVRDAGNAAIGTANARP